MKGNKGEWSEVYVFLKLLSKGNLYPADQNLNKIPNIFYPIIAIIRDNLEYHKNSEIKIIDGKTNKILGKVPVEEFIKYSQIILESIINSAKPSFPIEGAESFLEKIKCRTLKAPSKDKRDITIIIHDRITQINTSLGFSIKSKLGGASTLLNPSKSTNFIYEVSGPEKTQKDIEEINKKNEKNKIRNRINLLLEEGYYFYFIKIQNKIFECNLQVIDSNLPLIISKIIFYYYRGDGYLLKDLVQCLKKENPCGFITKFDHNYYEYKLKQLLTSVALGMTPAKSWSGRFDATGGYLVVREDGEVVCYHLYNYNEFQDYLFNNTKLETPSTKKFDFGYLFNSNNSLSIKLNLQIRFI